MSKPKSSFNFFINELFIKKSLLSITIFLVSKLFVFTNETGKNSKGLKTLFSVLSFHSNSPKAK